MNLASFSQMLFSSWEAY